MKTYAYYADNKWQEPTSGEYFDSANPYTGKVWAQLPRCNEKDVNIAVQAAYRAQSEGPWSRLNQRERGLLIRRLGDVLGRHADQLARIEINDNGMRCRDIFPDLADWLAGSFDYFADIAEKHQLAAATPRGLNALSRYTCHEPYGVVAGITSWHSPLSSAISKLAPALAAGNSVVLKPSELASASTLDLMRVFEEADLPSGLINTVTGFGTEVGEPLVNHPLVRKISFSGSIEGAVRVATCAARLIKSVTLEVDLKALQIVFDDARLEDSVLGVCAGIFAASGKSGAGGSSLLVQSAIYPKFVAKLVEVATRAKLGDPNDATTDLGPIANKIHYERVLASIETALQSGATLACGGKAVKPGGAGGWFIEPTVISNVSATMAITQQPIPGPVFTVVKFDDEEVAIRIANQSACPLIAGIWTENQRRALELAHRINAGTVVSNNDFKICTHSAAEGYQQSDPGRENDPQSFYDFVQTKRIWFGKAGHIAAPF